MTEPTEERETTRRKTIAEGLVWLVLAAFAYFMSLGFDAPLPTYQLGAAFWPQVVIAIIVIAALVLIASQFIRGKETSSAKPGYLDEVPEEGGRFSGTTLLIFALPLVWVYGMHKMGFLLVTPFFLLAFTWLMGVRRWQTLIGFSLGFYALLVLVFYVLIFTPLPMGAGWFHALNGEIIALIQ